LVLIFVDRRGPSTSMDYFLPSLWALFLDKDWKGKIKS